MCRRTNLERAALATMVLSLRQQMRKKMGEKQMGEHQQE
jgi:hypothetical protein